MKENSFDIIVIGAGSGGLNIAGFMNKAGFKVLLIDRNEENIGGDCLNYGCVPSKAMIHMAKLAYSAKKAVCLESPPNCKVDIHKVIQYVKEKQAYIRKHENSQYFRDLGMTVELGHAKFASPNSVVVNDKEYFAKKIILATGSRPRKLTLPGIEKVEKLYNNETIFDIDFLPENFLFIGGGPISIELGQCFQRFGSKVFVVQHGPHFLAKECGDSAEVLRRQLEREGMEFTFESVPEEFVSENEVVIKKSDGSRFNRKFDAVFVGIGRQLNIENLDLEKAGIDLDSKGRKIIVDDNLRTTNKKVYVCGDVAGSYQFTHAAELHAGVVLTNLFSPFKKKVSYDNLAWVTYTYPEIATFGLCEDTLKQRNIKYEKLELNFADDDRHIVDDFTDGKMMLLISKNKIKGGTIVSPVAGEIAQELILAQNSGLTLDSFFMKVYPYPTASRVNKKLVGNYFSKKLTPFVKKIMRLFYR